MPASRFSFLAFALAFAAPLAAQTDPRTPINSTTCPGDASYTYVISAPGSYYLAGNLAAAGSKSCVHVTAADVSIDLSGFTVTASSGAPYAIYGTIGATKVRNGGVSFYGTTAAVSIGSDGTVEGLTVDAAGTAVFAGNVRHCSVAGGATGIMANVVEGCNVSNSSIGIYLLEGGLATNCQVYLAGNYGYYLVTGAAAVNCTARRCGAYGFYGNDHVSFLGCISTNFTSGTDSAVGFYASSGSTVMNCTADSHRGGGFGFYGACHLSGNTARGNGGSGTSAFGFKGTGTNNRIDGNHAIGNSGTGILSSSTTADFTVRNTSFGNGTNYSPASGTYMGPVSTPSTATSPWANF